MSRLTNQRSAKAQALAGALAVGIVMSAALAKADEGGVSFWIPGFFGSLAAAPQQPGWALTSVYYHTSVSAGADVARAREFETGRISLTATANVSASLAARGDLGIALPTYTFASLAASLRWAPSESMAASIHPWRGASQAH